MRRCHLIEAGTPKGFTLHGLWFGPQRPGRALIWLHGLQGSAFSGTALRFSESLVDARTAVIVFSNRGHDGVATLQHRTKGRRVAAGTAHEVFTECVDDIEGMVRFARKAGASEIYLIGHSTGCQKSAYWAAKKGKGVQGLIWLAPISDYAGALRHRGSGAISKAARFARSLLSKGRPHELLPDSIWPGELLDAQRFLSLYTPDSEEEIFCYSQEAKDPKTLRRARLPVLAIFAGRDEYADRPAGSLAQWLKEYIRCETKIVPGAKHNFKGREQSAADAIRQFIQSPL